MTYHWIIQDDLYHEEGYEKLIDTLRRFQISHTIVSLRNGNIYPDIHTCGPTMICGAYTLMRIARLRQWEPGTFMNENHSFDKWLENYGDNMLNSDAKIVLAGDVQLKEPSFLRPVDDGKAFAGIIIDNQEEYIEWKDRTISLKRSIFRDDTKVVVSNLKSIYSETRFFIVDKQIISGSVYKQDGRTHQSEIIDNEVRKFAESMIDIWCPARAFVLDIAQTDNGCKIIEINCINCSGFYASDVQKIVMAMDSMNEVSFF